MLNRIIRIVLVVMTTAISQDIEQVISSIWQCVGGQEAYNDAKQLSFSFVVERDGEVVRERHHLWNRENGAYVLEQTDKEGNEIQVFFNINTKEGTVLKNGEHLSGEAAAQQIEQAYAKYINDTYWLLVPVKLKDPGVRLNIDANRSPDYEGTVLHLSFENVGLTPGDQYWLYVDATGSVTEWQYTLESGRSAAHTWATEVDCGAGLRFSTRKTSKTQNVAIVLARVQFSKEIDKERFKAPVK